AEFLRYTLPRDFPEVPAGTVTLLEAGPRPLPAFRPALGRYAAGALARLGERVRLGAQVAAAGAGWVRLSGGERLTGEPRLAAAAVRGNPLPGLPADARGRVPTDPCLRLVGYPEVYVVGDLNGLGFPQLAPVALQQGRWAARNLLRALREQDPLPFRYRDRGQLAVIG
ncbi:NAD(P)/FAD-dependent oxidoreductase, partial [Acinetobacter baumannii]|nr:NAD(P)/FAD-dependent oxidoreductase [Acinetobacter baumannii]